MTTLLEQPVGAADHIRGDIRAPITLVEYGDFECYYCARAHPIVRALRARFPHDLRFVFRHAPQARAHPNAELAAQAAEAAGAQDKFWAFHDYMFENFAPRTWPNLIDAATELDLDLSRFRDDITSGRFLDTVRAVEKSGAHTVRGTPTFFIEGVRYEDASDLDSLSRAIRERLTVAPDCVV